MSDTEKNTSIVDPSGNGHSDAPARLMTTDDLDRLAAEQPYKDVVVQGMQVRLLKLDTDETDAWEASNLIVEGRGKNTSWRPNLSQMRSRFLSRTMRLADKSGAFTVQVTPERIGKLPIDFTQPLYEQALALNAKTDADLEELAGKSDAAPASESV